MLCKYFIMEKCFSSLGKEPKKKHLMTLLYPIKYKWNVIGEQLGVPYDDVQYNEPYHDSTKLSEVLQVWIDQRSREVSWKVIIKVVEEPPIKYNFLADKIYRFLSRPDIQNEYLSSYQSGKF